MKSAPFSYERPDSLQDALRILDEHAGGARVLAGGQSLAPMLQMRLMQLSALVDINRLPGLDEIRVEGSGTVLGPMVRYATIESLPLVSERLPLLKHVVRYVGDLQVRNRGTIGGSLAQADPTGEMPLASLALDATIVAASVSGTREIPIDDFLVSSYATALEPEEMITEIRFPAAPEKFAFLERYRKHNDFAVINIAVVGRRDHSGRWSDVRMGGRILGEALPRVDDRRAAAEFRAHCIAVGSVGLLAWGVGLGVRGMQPTANALRAIDADQIWVVVDASRKAEDTAAWVGVVRASVPATAIAVLHGVETATPDSVNALGLPIGWSDTVG